MNQGWLRVSFGMFLLVLCNPITSEPTARAQEASRLDEEQPSAVDSKGNAVAPKAASLLFDGLKSERFDIATVSQKLRDEVGLNGLDAKKWIESRTLSVLGCEQTVAEAASKPSILSVRTSDGQEIDMVLQPSGCGALATDKELLVVAPREGLKRVSDMILTYEQTGIRQIVLKTVVLRDSVEAMAKLPVRWSYIESASRIAQAAEEQPPVQTASFQSAKQLSVAERYLERQKPISANRLAPPEGVHSATWTEATSIVERTTPVLYTLLTPNEYRDVLDAVRSAETIERVMSPSMVVFNGQLATVSNSVERPFVTGIKPVLVGNNGQQQVEFSPTVKVYPEGTTMKIQPELFEGTKVRLSYQLDLCKVRNVETLELPGVEGRGDFAVQIPEVASTQFRTCLEMPIDYALAVSATETDEHGEKRSIVVLCHCSLSDVEPANE